MFFHRIHSNCYGKILQIFENESLSKGFSNAIQFTLASFYWFRGYFCINQESRRIEEVQLKLKRLAKPILIKLSKCFTLKCMFQCSNTSNESIEWIISRFTSIYKVVVVKGISVWPFFRNKNIFLDEFYMICGCWSEMMRNVHLLKIMPHRDVKFVKKWSPDLFMEFYGKELLKVLSKKSKKSFLFESSRK